MKDETEKIGPVYFKNHEIWQFIIPDDVLKATKAHSFTDIIA